MKTLIIDFSPIYYRWIFSSTNEAEKVLKLEPEENGLLNFDDYKDIFIYRLFDDLSKMRNKFSVDEVVIATDQKPYWRSKLWSGYKHGRKTSEDKIDWIKASKTLNELLDVLENYSSFKVLKIPEIEGDDILFTLSEYLSKDPNNEIILNSLDHDIMYALKYPNVKYWQTKHTSMTKECSFVEISQNEIKTKMFEHCFFGDPGDNIKNIVSYTQFSKEFQEKFPDLTPEKAYPKRHEIDIKFKEKYGVSAYKHPRFGKKTFYKKQINPKQILEENPIHKWNFELNKKISLPSGIPKEIKEKIIFEYENVETTKNIAKLNEFFMKYGLIELIGITGLL